MLVYWLTSRGMIILIMLHDVLCNAAYVMWFALLNILVCMTDKRKPLNSWLDQTVSFLNHCEFPKHICETSMVLRHWVWPISTHTRNGIYSTQQNSIYRIQWLLLFKHKLLPIKHILFGMSLGYNWKQEWACSSQKQMDYQLVWWLTAEKTACLCCSGELLPQILIRILL